MRGGVRRGCALRASAFACLVLLAACGGSPNAPGPPPPPPPPPPANNLPVIQSITVQGSRPQQPPSFAELSEVVTVSGQVRDDETAVDQLQFSWSASAGTFSGTGAQVTWQAPAAAATPAVVTLTLEIVERYGTSFQHRVTRSAEVALHDSVREVGEMSRQFLLDFSDSNIRDVGFIMRNFTEATPDCRKGTAEETEEVARNRINYRITEYHVDPATVTVAFGGTCRFRSRSADACARIPVAWTSTRLTPGPPGSVGSTERVRGVDQIAAIYLRQDRKWALCNSDFEGSQSLHSTFIR